LHLDKQAQGMLHRIRIERRKFSLPRSWKTSREEIQSFVFTGISEQSLQHALLSRLNGQQDPHHH